MAMGGRLRRRSPPPPLRVSCSPVSSSSAFPTYFSRGQSQPRVFCRPEPTTWAAFLAGLVACTWLVGFVLVLLHRDGSSGAHLSPLPIPMRAIRGIRAIPHRRRRNSHAKELPKHYFQLSPPLVTTEDRDHAPWSWPVIHIVNTRFMQGQGTLVHLARSRLKLLEVVCLPSLKGQSIFYHDTLSEVYAHTKWEEQVNTLKSHSHKKIVDPPLLWIIKVAPNLDEAVLKELMSVLEPVKNFTLVVGSNTNFGIGVKPGGWRDGQAGQDILDAYAQGRVYLPDVRRGDATVYQTVRRAHEARLDRVVVETRLDADDAINLRYIAALQSTALRKLVDRNVSEYDGSDRDGGDTPSEEERDRTRTARWLYWCPQNHIQWNPSAGAAGTGDPGLLQAFNIPNMCVTAGLSLGVAVGTAEETVPRYEHSKVYWEIAIHHNNKDKGRAVAPEVTSADKHDCGLFPSSACAVLVADPVIAAFRARAMTSAGMHNIEAQGGPSVATPEQYKARAARLWERTILSNFGIETARAKAAAEFMQAALAGTVRDNIRGQCNHGHSCKLSSTEKLQMTIDILEEEIGGVDCGG